MNEQLQATPCLIARRMSKSLYIFFLMICGAAHCQPTMLSQIPDGSKNFVNVNGRLYYSTSDSLMTATPTSAPVLVAITGEPILAIYNIIVGSSFFFVTQASSGQHLWRSDGTTANTVQVFSETTITPLLAYHSQLYLRVNSTATGAELWKVDGAYNASILKDINPGPEYGYQGSLIVHNNQLYFFADAGTGTDLWQSNGTTAGTVRLFDFDDTDVYNPSPFRGLTSVNNLMFFTRDYEAWESGNRIAELWKSDATAAGTSIVTQYTHDTNFYNYLSHLIAFNGKLYFFHTIGDPPFSYLSVSDGTASGTQHLELVSIDGQPRRLINAEAWLLFYAESQSFTTPIEKSDGTTVTRVHEFSGYHSAGDEYINLTYTEDRAFFTDDIGQYFGGSLDLWQTDLETGVTQPLEELYNSSYNGSRNIVADDGNIFFTRTVSGQMSLWYYDPDAPPSTCDGTGNILQEIWANAAGTDVRAFDFSTQPTGGSRSFSSFETTRFYANNYASRMRGWICVPQTGDYTFWISSDDQSELYLSPNETEASKQLIAWVYGYTPFRKYDKYPSQQSVQISLQAGRKYYIEARHKEGNGDDFISVGWQLPDETMERPIAGNRLIPFTPTPPPCTGTGTIVREIWTNISGTSVSAIPVNSPPNRTVELTSFATPNYYANNYGSRIRGYLCAPASGAYTFWIASDDNSELWLSTNDDPATRIKIASVTGSTSVNQWTKYPSQVSGTVNLVQGQRYYIEVLHKEANGGDHVEVGWQIPSGPLERPIPGNRLIPFEDPSTSAAMVAQNDIYSFDEENTVSIFPNPVTKGKQVSINLPGATDTEVQVDIKSVTGVSVQSEMLPSTGDAVTIDLKPSIVAGIYLIRVSNNNGRWSTKLQVR
jgi:ELWxxDGT repeat protein